MEPKNPHDRLFKGVFSAPEEAAAWLAKVLPGELIDAASMDTLCLEPGSFVDEALGERHTDLLFSVEVQGQRGFLYVLLEHQRAVDRLMAYRMLRYMVRVWDRVIPDGAARLPFVLPVVVYNGRADWTAAVEFDHLLDLPPGAFGPTRPQHVRFRYHLIRLAHLLDDELPARALGRLALHLMKQAALGGGLWETLFSQGALLQRALREHGERAIRLVLHYILQVERSFPQAEIEHFLERDLEEETQMAFKNAAEQLREEGRAQGIDIGLKRGVILGERRFLQAFLEHRFGPLPDAIQRQLEAADAAQLQGWRDRTFDATDLAAIFGEG